MMERAAPGHDDDRAAALERRGLTDRQGEQLRERRAGKRPAGGGSVGAAKARLDLARLSLN